MLKFVFLLLPILEIYSMYLGVSKIGWVGTFVLLLTGFVLGLGLIRSQWAELVTELKAAASNSQSFGSDLSGAGRTVTRALSSLLKSACLVVGGLLILSPGFFSDVVGLVLILPGTRNLFMWLVRIRFSTWVFRNKHRIFTSSKFGGAAGSAAGFAFGSFGSFGGFGKSVNFDPQAGPSPNPEVRAHHARDVTPNVIDVTPVQSRTTTSDSGDRGDRD